MDGTKLIPNIHLPLVYRYCVIATSNSPAIFSFPKVLCQSVGSNRLNKVHPGPTARSINMKQGKKSRVYLLSQSYVITVVVTISCCYYIYHKEETIHCSEREQNAPGILKLSIHCSHYDSRVMTSTSRFIQGLQWKCMLLITGIYSVAKSAVVDHVGFTFMRKGLDQNFGLVLCNDEVQLGAQHLPEIWCALVHLRTQGSKLIACGTPSFWMCDEINCKLAF